MEGILDAFSCPICKDITIDPVFNPAVCSHVFCASHLDQLYARGGERDCPTCLNSLGGRRNLVPDVQTEAFLKLVAPDRGTEVVDLSIFTRSAPIPRPVPPPPQRKTARPPPKPSAQAKPRVTSKTVDPSQAAAKSSEARASRAERRARSSECTVASGVAVPPLSQSVGSKRKRHSSGGILLQEKSSSAPSTALRERSPARGLPVGAVSSRPGPAVTAEERDLPVSPRRVLDRRRVTSATADSCTLA
jgi:hypothetical protein